MTPVRTTQRPHESPIRSRFIGAPLILLAGFLASAGLPLYIHLPRFATEIGLSLSVMGALLLGFRLIDLVQDPILGLIADRWQAHRGAFATLSILGTGAGFFIVFTLQPGLIGLVVGLFVLFTAFSMGTILFYGQCAALAQPGGDAAHFTVAGRREVGTLTGIIIAALLPTGLGTIYGAQTGYAAFGLIMVAASIILCRVCRPFWTGPEPIAAARPGVRAFFQTGALRLLGIALLNALPVAITSSLFLFFVEDRLGLPDLAGVYLLLFFLAAAASAPIWTKFATRYGARPVLLVGMSLAVLSFLWTAILPVGAGLAFGLITLMSGAALGADMVILPAMFSSLLARSGLPTGTGFGAWFFAGKLALALAAATVLPVLEWVGYVPAGPNDAVALSTLNYAYSILPCVLKIPVIVMVARLKPVVPDLTK